MRERLFRFSFVLLLLLAGAVGPTLHNHDFICCHEASVGEDHGTCPAQAFAVNYSAQLQVPPTIEIEMALEISSPAPVTPPAYSVELPPAAPRAPPC